MTYDPFIYHYMRSFGLPRSYYGTYLTELTPPHLRRYRAKVVPATGNDPANPHPSRLPWVTPNILVLAANSYLKDDLSLHLARRRAEITHQRLLDAPAGRTYAGAARAHLHAQARLLAALIREWDTHQIPVDVRVPAPVTVERSDQRRKLTEERRARKRFNNERRLLRVEWQHIKEKYASIREDYNIARNEHRLATTPAARVAARRRRQALFAKRKAIHREYTTVKQNLHRFNLKHGLIHLPTS